LDSKLGTVTKDQAQAGLAKADAARSSSCWSRRRFPNRRWTPTMHAWDQAAAQLAADKAATESAQLSLDWTSDRAHLRRVSRINVTVAIR